MTSADTPAREREVLDLLLDGQDNRAIANDLFISVGTVKSHVHTIFRKCGVSSRSELLQSFGQVKGGVIGDISLRLRQ